MANRIDYDSRGRLDDIAISDVSMFRMEWMDSGQIWIRLYRPGDKDVIFWLSSEKKIVGSHELEGAEDIDIGGQPKMVNG